MLTQLPGLIDPHVHLRTPGQTHKEDLDTGTRAALAGGFTRVLDMPNTTPPTVDRCALEAKAALVRAHAHCDVDLFCGGTEANIEQIAQLADPRAGNTYAVGLKLYLNQTHGPLLLSRFEAALAHIRRWPAVVAVHAEGWQLAAMIGLAQFLGKHVHCCHVSRKSEIELIRAAKECGALVTCEVTPHHLFLTDADAQRLRPLGYMKPTLGTAADCAALWDNLDVFDCIASDHAPHTLQEKHADPPSPGVPGLETTLPLMLNAVHEGRLSLERLVELLYDGPRRVYGLPVQQTYIQVDLNERQILSDRGLQTKCGWTPFSGMTVIGRLQRVTLRGRQLFDRNATPQIAAPRGSKSQEES
jgi:carbamoyl-phosphate synthase/aspartate carbamoyltransferase/dihydroorotase